MAKMYPHGVQAARQPSVSSSSLNPVRPSLSTQLTANVQIVAGIISLLNDYQISQGKPPLGFLNPWLYGKGLKGLSDITIGSNPGCRTRGFLAAIGWDPVRPASLVYSLSPFADSGPWYRSQVLGRLTSSTCNTYLILKTFEIARSNGPVTAEG
jgi:hypothetical protein